MGAGSQIFDIVYRRGPLSRAELARVSGLSKPTVSAISRMLLEQNLIVENAGEAETRLGRPSTLIDLNREAWCAAGVDLGGTWVRTRVVDALGSSFGQSVEPVAEKRHDIVAQVAASVERLCREVGRDFASLKQVVVASPGVVSPTTGELKLVPNLPSLENVRLSLLLAEAMGSDVEVINDVNAAAYAQSKEPGGSARHFVFVAIGTGLGGGLVIDGEVYGGATGEAGEIGYLPYGSGTVEDIVSGAGLERIYRQATGREATAQEIFTAAAQDGSAARVVQEFFQALSWLVAVLSTAYNPERIFIGGGVGLHLPFAIEELAAAAAKRSPVVAPLAYTTLGADASLNGAVLRARDRAAARVLERL